MLSLAYENDRVRLGLVNTHLRYDVAVTGHDIEMLISISGPKLD